MKKVSEMSHSTFIIKTNSGPVRGIRKTTLLGDDYLSFQSIPYAKPPIGSLRFRDPVPVEPWSEPIDGTVQGPPCWAFDKIYQKTVGDENCLHLNVFTNDIHRKRDGSVYMKCTKPRPVMVYLYGGGFMWGSSGIEIYGPDYLMQKDVVFVSLNYRVGAFGFLSIKNPKLAVPGNAGLKDQAMALKWIKNNIQCFGGNPNNITLFGESAGGCSVHYMMMSDLAKDLFNKAILMSGCGLNNWSIVTDTNSYKKLAALLGWDETGGDEKAFKVLQNADPADIAKLQMVLTTSEDDKKQTLFSFGPVVEPYVSEQCALPATPIELERCSWGKKVPLLIGGTSDDGLYLYRQTVDNPKSLNDITTYPEYLVPVDMGHAIKSEKCKEIGTRIKNFYFGDKEPSMYTLLQFIDLVTDKWFWHGLHRTILARLSDDRSGPTYVYRFNFDSDTFNHYKIRVCGKGVRGTCHADDLSYLFRNIFVESIQLDSAEWLTISRMVGIWTTFAETGNPNDSLIEPIDWKPVTSIDKYFCLNISNDLSYIELPERKRMAFWDSLYEKEKLI